MQFIIDHFCYSGFNKLLRIKLRNLVTGGAGFLGSHLIDQLINAGEEVICLDNYFTGIKNNIIQHSLNPNFELIRHDVTIPIKLEVDKIWHFACPASPVHYQSNPIKTAKTSFMGTYNMLGLAKRTGAKFLMASTSEIYGDPQIHPQRESYRGNVNTFGTRACYDEGKRIAETLCFDYKRIHNVDIKVARIFNTYGPRMLFNDGRVISNFIVRALNGESIELYGDGSQTRSFCYVDDLITGTIKLMKSKLNKPVNLGNPSEFTIKELAEKIRLIINPDLKFIYKPLPEDDPKRRKPNIDKAIKYLSWKPYISLDEGLKMTIEYFKKFYEQ